MSKLSSLVSMGVLLLAAAPTYASTCTTPDGFMELEKALPWSREVSSPVTLVNLWAEWCPPCLRELPTLDALALSSHYAVETIHLGDNPEGLKKRFEQLKIKNLPDTLEPNLNLLHNWGFQGLPATMIVINDMVKYGYPGYIRTHHDELDNWLTCLADKHS